MFNTVILSILKRVPRPYSKRFPPIILKRYCPVTGFDMSKLCHMHVCNIMFLLNFSDRKHYAIFMYLFRIFNFSKLILQLLDRNGMENQLNRGFLFDFYPKAEELTMRN